MRIKKLYNFVMLAVFAGLFLTASAQAAILTVNSTNDPGNGVCDATECTLREAIAAASAGDTIVFSALFDTPQSITLSDSVAALVINKNLTITGKGASLTTVRRNPATTGSFRIFETGGGATVGISGLTVTGARFNTDNGGGIFVDGSSVLTLTGVVVTDNFGQSGGGILVLAGSTVNLAGSTVSNNNTLVSGGSVGGGIFSTGTLNINNSTVSGNSAANGGGIYSTGTLGITDSTISGNSANGGGIFIDGGTATLNNAIVSNNSATTRGGGIRTRNNATVTLTDSTVSGNTVTGSSGSGGFGGGVSNFGIITIINTTLTGNTGTDGAAINSGSGGTVNMIGSTVSNNTATGNNNTAGGIDNAGTLNVTNSTFSGNRSTGAGGTNGGAIWNFATATLNNVTITDNFAAGPNSASGIIRVGGTVNVKNTIVAANQNNATTPDVVGTSFVSNGYNLIGNVGTVATFNQTGDQTGTSAAPLDPQLAPLADNGGATQTHRLLTGSPAIDKGAAATDPITNTAITTDQRGSPRPVDDPSIPNAAVGNGSDIGAFEVQAVTAASVSISGRVSVGKGTGLTNAVVHITDQNGNIRTARTNQFGYYNFGDVEVGQTLIVNVFHKRYQFDTQVVSVNESLANLNFTAQDNRTLRRW